MKLFVDTGNVARPTVSHSTSRTPITPAPFPPTPS